MNKEFYMDYALNLARLSAKEGEVPVGAIVVCDGKIVGEGRNKRETVKNALHHAEIEAINEDCKNLVELNVSQENPYLSSVGDVVFNKDKTVLVFCLPSKTGEYVIPETVTEISDRAFTYSNLTSVTVGGNVKKIGM